jgi:hypothetical protein
MSRRWLFLPPHFACQHLFSLLMHFFAFIISFQGWPWACRLQASCLANIELHFTEIQRHCFIFSLRWNIYAPPPPPYLTYFTTACHYSLCLAIIPHLEISYAHKDDSMWYFCPWLIS